MIKIQNKSFDISSLDEEYFENSIERQLLEKMNNSNVEYNYNYVDELEFELELRKEIVNSAILLNKSGMDFETFDKSKCNSDYWERKSNGGFLLKDGVRPSDAINDIFINGYKYATECATALVIVYYKAVLEVFGEENFNDKFKNIYLMDWDVREPLLRSVQRTRPIEEVLLGDRLYFFNPEHDPETPEWQGENVIVLYNSIYYGHGIGIGTEDEIIRELNSNRKSNAVRSAYLSTSSAGRPDFKRLASALNKRGYTVENIIWPEFPRPLCKR